MAGILVRILDLFDARQVLKNSKLINNNEVSKSFKNGRLWPFCKVKCPILGVKLEREKKEKSLKKMVTFGKLSILQQGKMVKNSLFLA